MSRWPRTFLVRHGETEWNRVERLLSHTDMDLNATGQEQALRLGNDLAEAGVRFDRIVSSPLVRARRTAELIAGQLVASPRVVLDDRLVELDFGVLEGWTEAQLAGDPAAAAWRSGADHPGVETEASVAIRAASFWPEIPSTGTTLVVSHGRFLRVLLATCVLGVPAEIGRSMRMRNCRPAIVEPGPKPLLLGFNAGPPYG